MQCSYAVTDRVKKAWLKKHACELSDMASKAPTANPPAGFCRASKSQKHNVCHLELAAQVDIYRGLLWAQPA